jgi:hypothetical protein
MLIGSDRCVSRVRWSAACAVALGAMASHASPLDSNVGRYRFATGSSVEGEAVGQFATDGKLGPENSWVTNNRGRHRLNLFFDRPTEIARLHVYSGGLGNGPVDELDVQYLNNGVLQSVPGASISGNTSDFIDLAFSSPVTTTQLQVTIQDLTATVREVAAFPPSAGVVPFGSGVDPHLARAHRLANTTASSTVNGSSRRAVVDGFIGDGAYWQSSSVVNQWIALDLRDPPETNPVSVRTETTPVEIGSVQLHSGLVGGAAPIARGRFQTLDENSGAWVDIPGGSFSNNTEHALAVTFDAPITTAALRLIVQDAGGIVREIVPLPPTDVAGGWPIGSGVRDGDEPTYLEFNDYFHTVGLAGSGLAITSSMDGGAVVRPTSGMLPQQYQVLLNVGTDTYRICNRVTGLCLEPDGSSVDVGATVVEAAYFGFPSQRWRMEDVAGGVRFVNSQSGLVLSAVSETDGAALEQRAAGGSGQAWSVSFVERPSKKGTGGFPTLSDTFQNRWAYNWGPNDSFPSEVEFWPMQWGSFFWSTRPALMPDWMRNPEPNVLMGYNEPDKIEQANMPIDTAASMWPRLEILNMPLLGPAVAGHPATSDWIQGFMSRVDADELRLDYVGMHSYGGPNANSFINQITSARNAWGRDVVVSEFSVVDWSNTNSWTKEPVYNWFAEVLWRMEDLDAVHTYAVFIFTNEPDNPISDNRGEMREADGSLTPAGKLYAAWDGDTQVRSDTPYFLHNKASYKRPGVVAGQVGQGSTVLGGRYDQGDEFQWRLIPTATPGLFNIESVSDGTVLSYSARGLEMRTAGSEGAAVEFGVQEIQHGWFAIEESGLGRRLSSASGDGTITLANAGTVNDNVRWRFVPVLGGVPGPVRGGAVESIGGGDVELTWDPHGFRDLIGFTVYRSGPGGGGSLEEVAAGVMGETWIDRVPEPGTYTYSVSALGDTGESEIVSLGAVAVDTCPADFNGDFAVDATDVEAAVVAIGGGLDYDGDGSADFFDVLAFLRVHDEGCASGG